jgi:hypothetical protein
MARPNKSKKLTPVQQFSVLRRDYSQGNSKFSGIDEITWQGYLKSSPIGESYKIKVVYKKGDSPKIYVVEPKILKLPSGKVKLQHVYDHDKQRLCLFYPNEWDESKTLASTIFPWTIEWLYHYEIWFITGKWEGGGIHLGKK